MKEEYIRDFSGMIIGIVEYKDNGDQVVRSFASRQILGYYRKAENHTTDFLGRILSRGNTAISLIYENGK